MNDKETKQDNQPTEKKGFASFLNKAQDIGKKAADGIQKGAKSLSEQAQKTIHEQKMKKYNPLFEEAFKSENFKMPNVIQIVDSAQRRDIDVCEGAIGWTSIINDIEVLFIYEERANECGVQFLPFPKCDTVYCVDPLDSGRFINSATTFDKTLNEKIAELAKIAECLGAKSCYIEIVESNSQENAENNKAKIKGIASANVSSNSSACSLQSGIRRRTFEGNTDIKRPDLKWFVYDDNIINLIENRLSGKNTATSDYLELVCSSTTTMSIKTAGAIDKLLGNGAEISLEKKARKEHNSKLVFEINF